jgi:hypothetical protein
MDTQKLISVLLSLTHTFENIVQVDHDPYYLLFQLLQVTFHYL